MIDGRDQAVSGPVPTMNRLINEQSLELTDERLADLFRANSAFETDPFRKRRVFVSLMRARAASPRRPWLQAVLVATLLVSGTATAALGHRYVARNGFPGYGAAARAQAPSKAAPTQLHARTFPANQAETAEAPSDGPALAERAASANPPAGPSHAEPGARPRRASAEDVTRVVEAIQALRMDSDPSRAQGLLDDYLKAHPHGVLSADALALSIEAASAQHDPRAADYARRYLAEFPQGKYRDLAERALAKH
jgi:hypothetical protein